MKAIVFLASNELPLRGTDDYGALELDIPTINDGLLRDMLRQQIQLGDEDSKLILTAPDNMRYLSPKVQNEMLLILADTILQPIIQGINSSCCFSVLADETSRHSKEFLTLCIRYVFDCRIREVWIIQSLNLLSTYNHGLYIIQI